MGKRREEHAYSEEGNQKRKEDQGARVRVERRAKVTAEVRMVAQIVLPGKRKRMVAAERPAGMGQRELEDLREDEGSSPLSSITEMEREEEVNLASKSCRPEEMGVARWVGERVGREEENELYESFAKNGDVISLLDCVYVKPEEKDQAAYIMRIRKLWGCSTTGQMKFRGQWLYRPQDTKHGSSCCLHAREVFLSDWEDENPIDCVQTKCNVLFLDKPPTREADASDSCQPSSPLGRRFHYVCWRSYSVHTGEIRELADSLPGRKKTNPMSQRLKELRGEQEVLLLQVSDGRRAREAMQEAGHLYADALSR
ncbi:hypothetical protein GUITHDRAFT_139172 [Guillardia theta CCMP2712]|uniref:BAH domain-containing protein n=1 Tax=Guillardia theta (strain CCMP2712) TaxID=905079 RepID=L1J9M3_GUITC|nr:hypothetical protein GUITHDRAFT_139172 [Guillardia theta CCMP2712]EKX45258.1 hypothetical protein GUITHDRAFT_139172 [Guillardia theta CCMP2712]|eukprot:XP_005832238.1 hypothetical protein GUITHDRAFT_139172 [Guillardia theta CCMP2712]